MMADVQSCVTKGPTPRISFAVFTDLGIERDRLDMIVGYILKQKTETIMAVLSTASEGVQLFCKER